MSSNFGDFQMWVYADAVKGVNSRYPLDFGSIEYEAPEAAGRAKLGYAPAIEAYDCYDRLVRTLDPQAVKAAVEQAGLVTTSEGTLFELLCLFDMVDALREAGWRIDPLDRTFHGKLTVTGTRPDGRRVVLRYQRTPSNVPDSRYKNDPSIARHPKAAGTSSGYGDLLGRPSDRARLDRKDASGGYPSRLVSE